MQLLGPMPTASRSVQARSYFSWYAIANAPLLMSTRVDTLDARLAEVLQSPEVLAVSQDYAGRKGQLVSPPLSRSGLVWAKPLSARNGSAAFALNTSGRVAANVTVFFADVDFLAETNATVRDLAGRMTSAASPDD